MSLFTSPSPARDLTRVDICDREVVHKVNLNRTFCDGHHITAPSCAAGSVWQRNLMENIMRNDDRGALADSELDAVSGGMLYLKPMDGLADQGIGSLMSTLVNQLGNKLQVGGASQR
jgi:hypothetical protein